jgi:hypothetical protein
MSGAIQAIIGDEVRTVRPNTTLLAPPGVPQPRAAGDYTLMCRATNVNGETQPMKFLNPWDGRGYGNNMVFPFDVVVSNE